MGKLCLIVTALLAMALPAQAATGRAMSLNAAAAAIKAGEHEQVQSLCGITRACGYIVDERGHDIVLFGEVNPTLPAMNLDDLVVALRNAHLKYAQTKGHTRYYSAPGCSIDPNPQTMRDLRNIGNIDVSKAEEVEAYLDKWNEIGRRPQNVRVMGVPFDSRFAKVMVDADYYMKRLVNGSVALDIAGFTSLSDLAIDQAKKAFASNKTGNLGGYTMNRFWFSPAEATYTEQDGAISLKTCQVQLLTEEEFLTEHGIKGKGRANSLAKQFSTGFTKHYGEIAAQRPIYTELEGLFRLVGIARIMQDQGAKSSGLDYLLNRCPLEKVPVNRLVLGLTNCKQIDESDAGPNTRVFKMIMPSCGGVSMDVRPKRIKPTPAPKRVASSARTVTKPSGESRARVAATPKPAPRATPASLKTVVLASRKSPRSVSWDFKLPE